MLNWINVGPSNKAIGHGKKSKLINVGPTFIAEPRVRLRLWQIFMAFSEYMSFK